MSTNKNRNINIELLRIISILLVAFRHIFPSNLPLTSWTNVIVNAVTYYSVSIFILITGFFIYRENNTIKKIYKNYFFTIFIPFFVFVMIVLMFEKTILGEMSFVDGLKNIDLFEALKKFINGILHFTCTRWTYLLGHTWYIFTHTIIVLLFPLFQFLLKKFNKTKFIHIIIITYLIILFIIDILMMKNSIYYEKTRIIPKASMMALIGYIIYNYLMPKIYIFIDNSKNKIKTISKIIILLIILFIISFVILIYRQRQFFNHSEFLYYCRYESLTMTISVSIFMILYLTITHLTEIKNNILNNLILCLSKDTFYVFFIHAELIVISQTTGIYNYVFSFANNKIKTFIITFIYTMIIYLLSILIIKTIKYIINLIKKIFNRREYVERS